MRKSEFEAFRYSQLSVDCTNKNMTLAVIYVLGCEWAGQFSVAGLIALSINWRP